MNPNDSRLEALQRYSDGTATREETAALERALLEDAEFRAFAVEYLYLDGALEEFGARADAGPVVKFAPRLHRVFAAAAAVALMGCALWLWWPAKPALAPVATVKATPAEIEQVEVEVLQVVNAKIAEPHSGLQSGGRVRLDTLDLRSGEVRLRLPSEVELVVSGPAELRFLDPMHVRVLHGKVTVDGAGHRGEEFSLDSPILRVVNRGAQFGMETPVVGDTNVMVTKGFVDLLKPERLHTPFTLNEGEAVRVDASLAVTRIVNITGSLDPGEWSTKPPPEACSIVSVSDNFGASEGFHFYRIVPHGLRAGATSYSNRPHVWRAVEGQDFPAALTEADVVQTFFGELRRPAYAIEVTVSRPVELFVLMPKRGVLAAWLTEDFTRTGDEILLDEGGPSSRPRTPLFFEVWKRTISQAGAVTLGPGNRSPTGDPVGMYGIAAKELVP